MKVHRYTLVEACAEAGVEEGFVVRCLSARWVSPGPSVLGVGESRAELDEADVARLRLIAALQLDFGVNDEAVPVILHLLDQLYERRKSA